MSTRKPQSLQKQYSAGYGHRPSLYQRTNAALRFSIFGAGGSSMSNGQFLKSDDLKNMKDMSLSRESEASDDCDDDYEYDENPRGNFLSNRVATFQKNVSTLGSMIGGLGDHIPDGRDDIMVGGHNPQDEDAGGPFATFKKNMGTIHRKISPGKGDDALKRDLSAYLIEVDDNGNPQDTSNHGPLSTFKKNMETIAQSISRGPAPDDDDTSVASSLQSSLHGVSNFVKARVDTFSNNINFAQASAESMSRDLGTLDTFSKNINFAQEQAKSITHDLGTMSTFSKNINFAQEQAKSITNDLGSMETFNKNITFAQEQAKSITNDLGSMETFNKNISFAQSKAQSIKSGIVRRVSERSISANSSQELSPPHGPGADAEVPDVHESM